MFHKHLQTTCTKLLWSNSPDKVCSVYHLFYRQEWYKCPPVTQAELGVMDPPHSPTYPARACTLSFQVLCVSSPLYAPCCSLTLIISLWNSWCGRSALSSFLWTVFFLISSCPTFFPLFPLLKTPPTLILIASKIPEYNHQLRSSLTTTQKVVLFKPLCA